MTGTRTAERTAQESLPQPQAPARTHNRRPLPFLLGLDPTHSDGSNHRDNSSPTRSQEMRESWSTGEPSQEVQTQQREQSPASGHLSSHGPTQPSAPLADPAPFGPADPAAPDLVTQFLFCQARLRPIPPVHLPLGSVLKFPEGRVVAGAGSAPGSDPLGPAVNALRPDPAPWTPSTHPFPRGRSRLGTSPVCCTVRGRAPLLPLPPPPHARPHPGLLSGAGAGSRRGKRYLKRGVPVPVPPASRSPRLAPAAAAAPAPCPSPPQSATSSQAASAQAPGPLFPSLKEATIEKSCEREGHLYAQFRHLPIPCKPIECCEGEGDPRRARGLLGLLLKGPQKQPWEGIGSHQVSSRRRVATKERCQP